MSGSKKKYSDEEILEHLKDHYRRNLSISEKSFGYDKTTCSVSTVSARFGSWAEGIKKANLKIKDLKKYSDEEILKQLKEYYEKNKKISQYGFSKDRLVCNPSIVKFRFGTWEKALEKAGIKYKIENLSIEERKEKIKDQVKNYILKTKKLPSTLDYRSYNNLPNIITVNKYFGTKENLYTELGYSDRKFGYLLTKEEIIEAIKNFYIKEGREPKQMDFYVKNGLPTLRNIKKYFSGFTEAKISAGFKKARNDKIYKRKDAIRAIQDFYKREERYPLKEDFKAENDLPSLVKIKGMFGTLRQAREVAGLTKPIGKYKTSIDKKELERLLLKKYRLKGRRLTSIEIINDKDFPSLSSIYISLRKQSLRGVWEYIEKKYNLIIKINRRYEE